MDGPHWLQDLWFSVKTRPGCGSGGCPTELTWKVRSSRDVIVSDRGGKTKQLSRSLLFTTVFCVCAQPETVMVGWGQLSLIRVQERYPNHLNILHSHQCSCTKFQVARTQSINTLQSFWSDISGRNRIMWRRREPFYEGKTLLTLICWWHLMNSHCRQR